MPRRILETTREHLEAASLPTHGTTYTVIPHKFVIETALQELQTQGFEVDTQLYSCNLNGNVALGKYYLKYGNDPELGMLFSWANSYDKSMRFHCATGGFIHASQASIIAGNMGSFLRKHTGTAKQEAADAIKDQITHAKVYFAQILKDRDVMKNVIVSTRDMAELVGRLYIEKQLITKEQVGIIKSEMTKSSYTYASAGDTLWTNYNHIAVALKKSHPREWLKAQVGVHNFIEAELFPPAQPVDPSISANQTSIPGQIDEQEEQDSFEDQLRGKIQDRLGSVLGEDKLYQFEIELNADNTAVAVNVEGVDDPLVEFNVEDLMKIPAETEEVEEPAKEEPSFSLDEQEEEPTAESEPTADPEPEVEESGGETNEEIPRTEATDSREEVPETEATPATEPVAEEPTAEESAEEPEPEPEAEIWHVVDDGGMVKDSAANMEEMESKVFTGTREECNAYSAEHFPEEEEEEAEQQEDVKQAMSDQADGEEAHAIEEAKEEPVEGPSSTESDPQDSGGPGSEFELSSEDTVEPEPEAKEETPEPEPTETETATATEEPAEEPAEQKEEGSEELPEFYL